MMKMKRDEILKRLQNEAKNCGICGFESCDLFAEEAEKDVGLLNRCIYLDDDHEPERIEIQRQCVEYATKDIIGNDYDFILIPFQDEKSCREMILPFNPMLMGELDIKKGDIIVGRPMGQGCPVEHVMEVIDADKFAVITVWIVGPQYSRDKDFKEIGPYNVVGFEGVAKVAKREPVFGHRQRFLPGYCMMNLGHTGLVNFIIKTKDGVYVRLEDIIIGV
ncbi:MAG: Fe-S cluster protein [Methanophagales archaeon]|nr:Fe-S cluster protein [Methanophagales archaeon]